MKSEFFDIEFLKNEGKYLKYPRVFKYFYEKAPFSDRESYLQWKQDWRDAYKQLSADIREAKHKRKMKNSPIYWEYGTRSRIGRNIARQMMDIRTAAKELSMRMRSERLAA